jgi:1,4-dihydroxy-2-naphthoyl-CoA hydrolase
MATEGGERAAAGGFAELLGVELLGASDGEASARLEVSDQLLQPYGVVHGGVFASLAESVTSHATYRAVREDGLIALGQSNETTFMRPVSEGHVNAAAVARHRGRTTWVWDVEMTDDEGRLCALTRMTVAVRPASPGSG